jgi:predicted amidophosphoribosyltransferase
VAAEASRRLCARVKAIDPLWLPHYAGSVYHASLRDPQLAALFASDAVLVPVPGSATSADARWAAAGLATALRELDLAHRLWMGLRRQITVRKSSTAPSGERPTVREHYESFSVAPLPKSLSKIVLIDDVVTKGRTLLAAAARLQAELPHADIRAFALIRTQGFVQQLGSVFDSCHGVIRWAGGDARREP